MKRIREWETTNNATKRQRSGPSPQEQLFAAIEHGDLETFTDLLITRRVDVNAPFNGVTPLIAAINTQHQNRYLMIQRLMQAGADAGLKPKRSFTFLFQPNLTTAIEVARNTRDQLAVKAIYSDALSESPMGMLPDELLNKILEEVPSYAYTGDHCVNQVCHYFNNQIKRRNDISPQNLAKNCKTRTDALNILRNKRIAMELTLDEFFDLTAMIPELIDLLLEGKDSTLQARLIQYHDSNFLSSHYPRFAEISKSVLNEFIRPHGISELSVLEVLSLLDPTSRWFNFIDISRNENMRDSILRLTRHNDNAAQWFLQNYPIADFSFRFSEKMNNQLIVGEYNLATALEVLPGFLRSAYVRRSFMDSFELHKLMSHPEIFNYILSKPKYLAILEPIHRVIVYALHGQLNKIFKDTNIMAAMGISELVLLGTHNLAFAQDLLNNRAYELEDNHIVHLCAAHPEIKARVLNMPLLMAELFFDEEAYLDEDIEVFNKPLKRVTLKQQSLGWVYDYIQAKIDMLPEYKDEIEERKRGQWFLSF